MIPLLLFVFWISPKTLGKQFVVYQSWPSYDAQVEQSPHNQFCQRISDHLLQSAFFQKQLSFKDSHGGLLLCFGVILTDPWFITCDVFLQHFFTLCQIVRNPTRRNLFLQPGVHAILNVYRWKKYPRMPISHGMSHDDLALSVLAPHQCSLTQWLFLDDL